MYEDLDPTATLCPLLSYQGESTLRTRTPVDGDGQPIAGDWWSIVDTKLPLIYVRGYAGGQSKIDQAVTDPFYGFNEGSTHIRVGRDGQPQYYQYEGPLIRLINEEDYVLRVRGSQERYLVDAEDGTRHPNSVWIYRYYDGATSSFGETAEAFSIERAAEGLAAFIQLVRDKTVDHPPVLLVAHSMGGLICRVALEREILNPTASVAKLCTIGTPHGGIDPVVAGPVGPWLLANFGPNGSDMFAPKKMSKYIYGENVPDVRVMKRFPAERVLSIVGTNSRDYENGFSTFAMGVQSDGLVAIRNAYVKGSARTYVHRSHSGRYGLVNSEEVYQTLKRFLFGGLRVEVQLEGLAFRPDPDVVWQAELRLAIRGIPVLIHEQTAEHYCPIDLEAAAEGQETDMAAVPLVTVFLMTFEQTIDGVRRLEACRYALDLKIASLVQDAGLFNFATHMEQIGDWRDSLIVDVALNSEGGPEALTWEWNSRLARNPGAPGSLPRTVDLAPANGGWVANIPLPESARVFVGAEAQIHLVVKEWPAFAPGETS